MQNDQPHTTIADKLSTALDQLLREALEAGFGTATDYNWPKAINDAKNALADYKAGVTHYG